MSYVDGFVLAVPKKNIPAYRKMARISAKVWREHGALAYYECLGDDLNVKMGLPFPKLLKTKPSETVVFSWIVYGSKAQRNRVNRKIMKDPRMTSMCSIDSMPFEIKRMSYGGFKPLVVA